MTVDLMLQVLELAERHYTGLEHMKNISPVAYREANQLICDTMLSPKEAKELARRLRNTIEMDKREGRPSITLALHNYQPAPAFRSYDDKG